MHLDPILPKVVAAAFVVLLVGMVLRRLKQPHVVAYLVAGMVLGPHGLDLLTDTAVAARIGEFGVVLLLFFVGMEVSLPRLVANWKVAIIGTALQIGLTVAILWGLGRWLGWPVGRSVLLGFVVCLSSTAVVVSMLREWGQLDAEIGHDTLGVLLVQDLALAPMLLVIGLMGDEPSEPAQVGLQIACGVIIFALMAVILRRDRISLPFAGRLREDHELQVFSAFVLCFGFATLTALAQLSTALGAFVAGVVIASARETEWVHDNLDPLRVLLVALFFVSVGMLVDPTFLMRHWRELAGLVVAVLILNTVLNATILRVLGRSWSASLHAGAMLAQVGEFSFVLAAVGLQRKLIDQEAYLLAVGLIVLSLLLSPAWVELARRVTHARA